ncbi:MAG: glycosyltransferase family 4 protein [Alphaproteobacteria bacterium]|nr:glycosyltransferase family 4 protein [Alphaproteobacteria bacterium]
MPKRSILQVLPALNAGGVEQGTIDMAGYLVEQNWESWVASAGGFRAHEVVSLGAHHQTLPLTTKNPFCLMGANKRALARLIGEQNISLVHARSRAPAWSAYFAAQKAHIPFVTTFHGTYNFSGEIKKLYNSVMVRGSQVIAISHFIKDHILAHYSRWVREDQIRVIHRGINTDFFDPARINQQEINLFLEKEKIARDARVWLVPGRVTRWKGHEAVLRAFAGKVSEKDVLIIVGDESKEAYVSELKNLTQALGMTPFVRFLGHRQDMPLLYAASFGVIHAATDPEAFGRVVAEAQAMGKPCLVSDLGAPQEIIKDGVTGWTWRAADGDALMQKVCLLEALPHDARASLVHEARGRVLDMFSLGSMCQSTLALYEEVLASFPKTS